LTTQQAIYTAQHTRLRLESSKQTGQCIILFHLLE